MAGNSSHPRRHGLAERLGRSVGKTIDKTAGSLGRVLTGATRPVIKKVKVGAAPGIEHRDLEKMASAPVAAEQRAYVSCIDYSPEQVLMCDIIDVDDFIAHHRPDWSVVRWINVDGLCDMRIIHALAKKYELHPLAVEDVLHVPQRPKVDAYTRDNSPNARLFVIARMLMIRDDHLHREQVSIFLGHKTILTIQETHGDVWDPIRLRINTAGSRLRLNDASFLAYALLDSLVDHCFPILERYGDRLDALEERILENPTRHTIHDIHLLRRDLLMLRRDVWPMREVVHALQREPHECMSDNTRTYLRDVYDHCVQIIDIIETYREIATGLTETYMTAVSNRMNEVMKVLTLIGTIFIPLTFLAGVYGMNFRVFPELDWWWAYPMFWVICIALSGSMIFWFKRRGWL